MLARRSRWPRSVPLRTPPTTSKLVSSLGHLLKETLRTLVDAASSDRVPASGGVAERPTGYLTLMDTPRKETEPPDLRSLMNEALWGIGLVGGVLLCIGLLVLGFGR